MGAVADGFIFHFLIYCTNSAARLSSQLINTKCYESCSNVTTCFHQWILDYAQYTINKKITLIVVIYNFMRVLPNRLA